MLLNYPKARPVRCCTGITCRACLYAAPRSAAVSALLAKLGPVVLPPEALRGVRGVQVLEMIADPDTRKVLAVLAGDAVGARLIQEARAY